MKPRAPKADSPMKRKAGRRAGTGWSVNARKAKQKVVRRPGKGSSIEGDLQSVFMDAVSDARARWVWFE